MSEELVFLEEYGNYPHAMDWSKSPDQTRITVMETSTGIFNIVDSFPDFCTLILGVELTPYQLQLYETLFPAPLKYSRRYHCLSCGHKGRVAKSARGPTITCAVCKTIQAARLIPVDELMRLSQEAL